MPLSFQPGTLEILCGSSRVMPAPLRQSLFTRRQKARLALAFGVAFLTPISYGRVQQQIKASANIPINQDDDVTSVWTKEAPCFDQEVRWTESLWGINYLRRRLLKRARGKTLEVGVGTGRNLETSAYTWPWQKKEKGFFSTPSPPVTDLTCIDLVVEMLREAETKAAAFKNGPNEQALREGRIHFIQGDAAALPFPKELREEDKFDTVIQTMGLCSESDPHQALKEMQRVCKRDGQILLLEHGRSTWPWLNHLLDGLAKSHAVRFGCWWNRDIGAILHNSGLIIETEERWHLGTTSFIIAKPGQP